VRESEVGGGLVGSMRDPREPTDRSGV
jgi:hypothetical protein